MGRAAVVSLLNVLLILRLDAFELLLHGSVLISHAQVLLLLLVSLLLQVLEVAAGRLVAGNNLGQVLELLLQVALRLQNALVLLALLFSLVIRYESGHCAVSCISTCTSIWHRHLHMSSQLSPSTTKERENVGHTCFFTISIFSSLLSKSRIMKKVRFKINDKNKVNPVRYLIGRE